MNKEEKDVIDFLKVSAITKTNKIIISREDAKHLLNYINKLQEELKGSINARFELQRRLDKILKDLEEFYKKYNLRKL